MYYLWTKENLLESSKRIIHFPKFVRQEKKLQLDNLELGSVENQHYGTPNLIFACVSQEILHLAPFFFTGLRFNHKKDKKSRRRCLYYLNSCAYRQLLLQGGDISVNPGPAVLKPSAPRCSGCERPVAKNHKRCICSVCAQRFLTQNTCCHLFQRNGFALSALSPFFHFIITTCFCLIPAVRVNCRWLKILLWSTNMSVRSLRDLARSDYVIINTQSMVSSFDELLAMIQEYPFNIVTMSETYMA